MKAKILIPLLLLCLATSSPALSPEGKEAYGELVAKLNNEIEELAVHADDNQNEILSLRQYLRQLDNALAQQNNRNIIQILSNFGNFVPSAKVQKALDSFQNALENETAANTRAYIAELEGILTKAADTLHHAEKPEDLDKILDSLNRNQFRNDGEEDFDGNDPTVRRLVNEISGARQFVAAWQDYIQASNAGNIEQSIQSLRNLAQQETTLVPRSQILARIAFEQGGDEEFAKLLEEIPTLDDMREGIRKMSKRKTGGSRGFEYGSEQQEIFTTLKRIDTTYRDFLAGMPVRAETFQQSNDPSEATALPAIVKLRADLLRLTLPRMLELPADTLLKENENIDNFMTRATHEAVRRDDIAAAIRIRDMRQYIFRTSSQADKDSEALSGYYSARQQIEAKQWMPAVISLHETLKSGCSFIPAAKVGELLEAIRKEHPEDYKQGMDEFLSSGSTPDSRR